MYVYLPVADLVIFWPLLVLFGLAIGVLLGFFGIGGGWLATPALNILGFPISVAIGTTLAYSGASAVVGALRHHRLGNLGTRLGGILGLSGVLGIESGRRLVLYLESVGLADVYVRYAYMLLLWAVGLAMLAGYLRVRRSGLPGAAGSAREADAATSELTEDAAGEADDVDHSGKGPGGEPAVLTPVGRWVQSLRVPPLVRLRRAHMLLSVWVLVTIGFGVGLVAGFLGTGGGFLLVPALVYVVGVPIRVAVASSLLTIVMSNGYGAASYGVVGRVEFLAAGLMLVGALAGAQLGALASSRVPARNLQVLLAVALLLAGCAVLLQQLQFAVPALVLMFGTAFAMMALILALLGRELVRGE